MAKNIKDKDSIYIKILLWAYKKQEAGFTWEELKKEFQLSDLQEEWVRKIFLTASNTDRKFFEILRNDESVAPNVYYYSLNEKGMSSAINYLSLKQAEKNSNRALSFAGISLLMAAFGLFLTVISLRFIIKQTDFMEIQIVPEKIMQAQRKNEAIERCKNDQNLKESGLFYTETGRDVPCSELLKLIK